LRWANFWFEKSPGAASAGTLANIAIANTEPSNRFMSFSSKFSPPIAE
jgi:hypothetical protein